MKGISGHTIVIVISLIVAMIGLVILWLFLNQMAEYGIEFGKKISCALCKMLRSIIKLPLFKCTGCV